MNDKITDNERTRLVKFLKQTRQHFIHGRLGGLQLNVAYRSFKETLYDGFSPYYVKTMKYHGLEYYMSGSTVVSLFSSGIKLNEESSIDSTRKLLNELHSARVIASVSDLNYLYKVHVNLSNNYDPRTNDCSLGKNKVTIRRATANDLIITLGYLINYFSINPKRDQIQRNKQLDQLCQKVSQIVQVLRPISKSNADIKAHSNTSSQFEKELSYRPKLENDLVTSIKLISYDILSLKPYNKIKNIIWGTSSVGDSNARLSKIDKLISKIRHKYNIKHYSHNSANNDSDNKPRLMDVRNWTMSDIQQFGQLGLFLLYSTWTKQNKPKLHDIKVSNALHEYIRNIRNKDSKDE